MNASTSTRLAHSQNLELSVNSSFKYNLDTYRQENCYYAMSSIQLHTLST